VPKWRVEVQLLPLRLQLKQGTVAFLHLFFAPFVDSLEEPGVLVEHADALTGPEDFEDSGGGSAGCDGACG